ncbi:hypothetical protein [Cerasicoccus maritimus]|uniref:hypothetical protein n=1 Tax=Cerasicoccus maritimus TaxID=490089 RepID=UPI002852C7A6|nr:hypothetical protein [Cerasicoccus maritimus]
MKINDTSAIKAVRPKMNFHIQGDVVSPNLFEVSPQFLGEIPHANARSVDYVASAPCAEWTEKLDGLFRGGIQKEEVEANIDSFEIFPLVCKYVESGKPSVIDFVKSKQDTLLECIEYLGIETFAEELFFEIIDAGNRGRYKIYSIERFDLIGDIIEIHGLAFERDS